jgi:hypothetical protein
MLLVSSKKVGFDFGIDSMKFKVLERALDNSCVVFPIAFNRSSLFALTRVQNNNRNTVK